MSPWPRPAPHGCPCCHEYSVGPHCPGYPKCTWWKCRACGSSGNKTKFIDRRKEPK